MILPKIDTDEVKMSKRLSRTKDVVIENRENLLDVAFDLEWFSGYVLDENLKTAQIKVDEAIEILNKFILDNEDAG